MTANGADMDIDINILLLIIITYKEVRSSSNFYIT